jgi:hypothetical protein
MAVTGQHDRVVDPVVNDMLERPVTVRDVAVPFVRRAWEVGCAFIDAGLVAMREENLITDDAPGGAPVGGLGELVVEPLLLAAAHERTGGVIREVFANVFVVPPE